MKHRLGDPFNRRPEPEKFEREVKATRFGLEHLLNSPIPEDLPDDTKAIQMTIGDVVVVGYLDSTLHDVRDLPPQALDLEVTFDKSWSRRVDFPSQYTQVQVIFGPDEEILDIFLGQASLQRVKAAL